MARKFLFLIGIVAAHGVLAAGLTSGSNMPTRTSIADTCTRTPDAPLQFDPPRELLAYVVTARGDEGVRVGHP